MGSKNINRIKIHRSYTVKEVSELFDVHPKTVRNWIRAGLPVADGKRPLLINGIDLKIFLKKKRNSNKYRCEAHEMCCFKCKQATNPSIELLSFTAKPGGMVQMSGRCNECGCKANKYVSWRDVEPIWLELGGKLPIAEKHLNLREKTLLNYPLSKVFDDEKK